MLAQTEDDFFWQFSRKRCFIGKEPKLVGDFKLELLQKRCFLINTKKRLF